MPRNLRERGANGPRLSGPAGLGPGPDGPLLSTCCVRASLYFPYCINLLRVALSQTHPIQYNDKCCNPRKCIRHSLVAVCLGAELSGTVVIAPPMGTCKPGSHIYGDVKGVYGRSAVRKPVDVFPLPSTEFVCRETGRKGECVYPMHSCMLKLSHTP